MRVKVVLVVLLLTLLPIAGLAEKTIVRQDSMGGNVEETTFEEGDNEFRYGKKKVHYDESGYKVRDERYILANDYNELGVEKTVKTFYKSGQLKAVEVVFRYEKAMAVGYDRILLHYHKTGTRRRMDVHFKDEHRDKRIYSHSSSRYDLTGVKIRTTYYFTERLTATTGYHRIIETYDQHGNKTSEKILDRDGNEF